MRNKIRTLKIFAFLLLAALVSTVSAAVFTQYYANVTGTVRTPDLQLVAGPDNIGGTVYPTASVTVASTYDYATITTSMFPSETNTPQPATYYTNLLQIKNIAAADSHTISGIRISDLSGMSNLGGVTIYYYTTQTDTPESGTPVGSITLTSVSSGTYTFTGFPVTLAAGATNYFEIVEYAASTASPGATVSFSLSVSWT